MRLFSLLFLIAITKSWECIGPQDHIEFGPASRRYLLSRSASLSALRIHFSFYNISNSLVYDVGDPSLEAILDSVKSYFYSTLKGYSVSSPLLLSEINSCGSEVIVPDSDKTYGISDTDILIYVTSNALQGQSYMAYSGSCAVDSASGAVYAGRIVINQQNYIQSDYSTRLNVLIHETTHILGFSSGLMKFWKKNNVAYLDSELTKSVTMRGSSKTLLVTPNVLTKVRELCATLEGAELEDQGGSGTSGSHWEMRTFYNDIMISHVMQDVIVSKITLALLKDTGWYDVNYTMGQELTYAKSAGCDFFNKKCVNDGADLEKWFCSTANSKTCDFFALNKAYCNIATYTKDLPASYQYFSGFTKKGGSDLYMDYCPYRQPSTTGACRGSDSGTATESSRLEKVGMTSRCFVSTLSNTGSAQTESSACYETTFCDSSKITLKIESVSVDCPYDGSTVSVAGYTGTVKCPTHNYICGDVPCKYLCSGLGACVNGVCVCKAGYSGDYCNIACGSYCAQCSSTACLVCLKANMVVSGKNCVCATGYLLDYSGSCSSQTTSCNSLCSSCTVPASAPTTKICTMCTDHASYSADTNTCTCLSYYYDNGSGSCTACQDLCVVCTESTCSQCVNNAEIINDGSCRCSYGFYSKSGSCLACESGCANCISSTKCLTCFDRYYLTDDNCESCPSACAACDQPNSCSSCSDGYNLYKTQCLESCPSGYYSSSNTCYECSIAFCIECDHKGNCSSCDIGFTLTQGVCLVSCPTNCLKCSYSGFCTSCGSGYYLNQGKCYSCSTGCKICTSSSKCSKCDDMYVLMSGACSLSCSSNCKKCSDPKTCTSCMPGYYLDSACIKCPENCKNCISKTKCTTCATGYTLSQSSCIKNCPRNCQDCKSGTCYSCDIGFVLNYGKCNPICPNYCSACDSVGKCLKCDKGFYLNSGFCTECQEGCEQCENFQTCSQCADSYILSQGQCNPK